MRRTVTLLGVFLLIAVFAVNGFAQPRTMGARGLILDDGSNRRIQIADLNRSIGIGTNNPDPSSILHLDGLGTFGVFPPYGTGVNSSDGVGPRGVLLPRMTTAQRNDIENPANGLLIYNTDAGQFQYYNGGTFSWTNMATSGWSVLGNTIPAAGTGPGGNFIGTLNAQDFVIATNVGVAGSGLGERIRVTSAGAVNILTSNVGTTAIGMTGVNSSSTAINVGNTGNLLFNNLGVVSAPFELLAIHTGSNEVKRLGGGAVAEQGVTFNNEGGNTRFRLGGLANTDNPLLVNRFVNLAGNTLFFTNSALANLVALNGSTNAVDINTVTGGATSIGSTGAVNISATGADVTITTDPGATANDLILNGIDVPAANFDLLVINTSGDVNAVGRASTINLTQQGVSFDPEGANGTRIRLGALTAGNAAALYPLLANRFVNLDAFTLSFNRGAGTDNMLSVNGSTNVIDMDGADININAIGTGTTDIGNSGQMTLNATAADLIVNSDPGTTGNDLTINGLDAPQLNFDFMLINVGGADPNAVVRENGINLAEQGVTFDVTEATGGKFRLGGQNRTLNPLLINRFVNLNNMVLTYTDNAAAGNDFLTMDALTSTLTVGNPTFGITTNINTGGYALTTVGNGVTSNQHLRVNGVVDAVIPNTLGANPTVWDFVVAGDQVTTGLAKFGGSIWIDGYTGNHRIEANSQLRLWTDVPQDLLLGTNLDDRIEIDGATGNVGIQLPAAPISPLQVSGAGGANAMPSVPGADGIHMGVDVIGNHGISLVDGNPAGSQTYIDFTNDFVNDYDARISFIGASSFFRYETPGNVIDQQFSLNGNIEMTLDGATGNTSIGTNAVPTANHQLYVQGTSGVPNITNTSGIQTIGTSASNLLTFGQVDGSRAWIQSNGLPLTINELGQNVTIGALAGGYGPATNTLLGDNNIITSNNDITMTVGTDPGDELTLINIDPPTENIDVLVIHDQATPNPNFVRRAENNTNDLTEQGITFNDEGVGQGTRIRLGSATNGTDVNLDAPFEYDRFVNLVQNSLTFTGGAASTSDVLNIEGSAGVVNQMTLNSLNAGNTIFKLNGPANIGIDIDPVVTGITIDATVLGIDVGTGATKPTTGINVQPNITGINIDGNANTTNGVIVDMTAPVVTTGGATLYRGSISGAAVVDVNGQLLTVNGNNAGPLGQSIVTTNTGGVGFARGSFINTTNTGTGSVRSLEVIATGASSFGGGVDGAVISSSNSSVDITRAIVASAVKTGGGATATTGIQLTTQSNGTGTVTGINAATSTPGGTGNVMGINLPTSGAPGAGGSVMGINSTVLNNGANSDVFGLNFGVTKGAAGGSAVGAAFGVNGAGNAVNATGVSVVVNNATTTNTGVSVNVANAGNVGVDITHSNIGLRIAGGNTAITNDGANFLGNNAGNDQLIVSTGTGPTTINTLLADVTINTDAGSGTGNDLVLTGIDENPTSPFDILVIEDGTNAVRRANSDASNQITEQGITFNTEGGQTRIRLGDLAAGVTVANAPFEADRFVNLVQNSLNFTGGAASTSNVMRIQGNNGGALDQVSMTSLNATNTSVLKLNGPAVTGLDIDPVQFGIRIDATNTLMQQTGSVTTTGIDMSGPGISATGITIDDNDGVPSLTGLIVGGTNLALVGATVNASTGYVSTNSVTNTFTSFAGNGATYLGDNSGVDELIVAADAGEITMVTNNGTTGINLTTTSGAVGADGIDIVASGTDEDVDISGNDNVNINSVVNDVNITGNTNVDIVTTVNDITLTAFDDNILSATDNSITATTGSNTVVGQVNNSVTANTGNNSLTATLGDNLLSATDNSITATSGNNTILAQVNNSITATTGSNTVIGQVNNSVTANTGNNSLTATLGDNLLSATDNSMTATSGSNTLLAQVNNSLTATTGDNSLTAGDDNLITATDDNTLLATDNSITATTGSNTILAQVNNSVTATTGNNSLTATAGDNILSATDNSVTATSGSNTVLAQVNNSITATTGSNQLLAQVNNTFTATTGDNSLTAGDDNMLTATDDNILQATDNSITATTGSNALLANVNNSLTATTGNNALAASSGDNLLTATDNTLTATTGNNTLTATLGDNVLSATDNSITATSGSNTTLAQVNNTITATTGDNTLAAPAGENYLNAPVNRVGSAVLPTSTLHVGGSVAAAVSSGGTTALTITQFFYLVNAATQTITLPNATTCQGRIYVIKNNAVATNTLVNTAGGNIDGAATYTQVAANSAVQYISDGANWWIISTN